MEIFGLQGEKRKSSSAAGKEIADLTRSERKRVVFLHPQGEKRGNSSAAGKEIADLTRSERKRVVFCTRKEKSEKAAAQQARKSLI